MADEFEFDIEGFEELKSKFESACARYSDVCAQVLEKKSREFKKELIKNTDDAVETRTGNLKKGYKFKKTEFLGNDVKKDFQATAPHFHLVEKGHYQVTKNGQRIGWVNGQFFLKRTVEEFPPRMVDGMQEVCDLIVKECEK